jgi:hypothetical protein
VKNPPGSSIGPNAPPPGGASQTGVPHRPPSPAVRPGWRRAGASIGVLGAMLALWGVLVPMYGSSDFKIDSIRNNLLVVVGLLTALAVYALSTSIWALFRKPPLWLVAANFGSLPLAFVIHWFAVYLYRFSLCFDGCPAGGGHLGFGLWMPPLGFVVCGIGLLWALLVSIRWRTKRQPAQAA